MARNNTTENQGGEVPFDSLGSSRAGGSGTAGLNVDRAALRDLTQGVRSLGTELKATAAYAKDLVTSMGRLGGGGGGGGRLSNLLGGGGGGGRTNMPMAGTVAASAGAIGGGGASRISMPTAGATGGAPGGGGGGGGPVSGLINSTIGFAKAGMQPLADLNNYMNQRIGQGADYSLQADRMSVQLQQMYGMSNADVRSKLRMPLTSHYLLGGGDAINQMLNMQATTGLTASKQASTVEAFRTISGFSYGAGDVTRMLSTMAAPDTANRMFMMGGTGMYGMGGKERTGMQSIQDIVRRTGLTNPEALKGALQQGSNTRNRLNAMGVPADMQDMVIQYAMQNSEYQKKTGAKAMYDPSTESDRKTMGIEGSYIVQHEKTTGERIKREERFYGRQVDNFADFEKNLRSSTKMLAMFEDKFSAAFGLKISTAGHPITNAAKYGIGQGMNMFGASMNLLGSAGDLAAGAATGPGGDAIDALQSGPLPSLGRAVSTNKVVAGKDGTATRGGSGSGNKLPADTERKLATLDPRLAVPLRKMLEDKPEITIGDTVRSYETQKAGFLQRYQKTNKTKKTRKTDREWNGVIWEMKPGMEEKKIPAMAPPGQSYHELGLAADLSWEHKDWIRKNAGRYGLSTGYTGTGGSDDEPFHVQPKGTGLDNYSSPGGGSSGGGATATVGTGSGAGTYTGRLSTSSAPKSTNNSTISGVSGTNYQEPYRGNAQLLGGDPVDGGMSLSGVSGGGAPSIVISPTIYLQGGQNMATDMNRIAQEVGRLLEKEVKLSMMRGS